TVNNAWQSRGLPFVPQYSQRVLLGFARMNHGRQSPLACEAKLFPEGLPLNVARRVVVVIIKSNLPPADHTWMTSMFKEPVIQSGVEEPGFVRMNADGGIDEIVLFGEPERGSMRVLRYIAVAHTDDRFNARVKSPLDYQAAVAVEVFALDMGV